MFNDDAEFGPRNRENNTALDFRAVRAMFDNALASGVKKIILRFPGDLKFSLAPMNGANPGAIYITRLTDDLYLGKVVKSARGDVFQPKGTLPEKVWVDLRSALADPKTAAIAYGRETGNCCICGKLLTNEESVKYGIGPICAGRVGFVFEAEEVSTSEVQQAAPVAEETTVEEKFVARNLDLSSRELEIIEAAMSDYMKRNPDDRAHIIEIGKLCNRLFG